MLGIKLKVQRLLLYRVLPSCHERDHDMALTLGAHGSLTKQGTVDLRKNKASCWSSLTALQYGPTPDKAEP